MSQENVELVERTYALIEDLRGPRPEDFDRPLRELVHDAFELHLPEVYPEGEQVFRGPEGLKSWIAMFKEVWGEWRFELERVLPAGDRVVALIRVLARGGSSGVRLSRETAHLWTIKDGRVASCEVYLDRSEGLEAVGLQSSVEL
jgi:ketosteroid isomerase-like protein